MALRPADFKSDASTGFATQACPQAYDTLGIAQRKTPPKRGFNLEAEVGIEPAYADLQSAA